METESEILKRLAGRIEYSNSARAGARFTEAEVRALVNESKCRATSPSAPAPYVEDFSVTNARTCMEILKL